MKKIKNNYTNFILTVIAIAMIGILFKGEIIKPAHALDPFKVNATCVDGYKFAVVYSGEGVGIVQFMRKSGVDGSPVPRKC